MRLPAVGALVLVAAAVAVHAQPVQPVVAPLKAEAAGARQGFGKRWVRTHPYTLMALVLLGDTLDMKTYADAGMNTVMAWKGREEIFQKASAAGMPWQYQTLKKINAKHADYERPLTDAVKENALKLFRAYPGGAGFLLWDEPRRPHFPKIAEGIEWFRATFPDALVYSNAYGTGAAGKFYHDMTERDAAGKYPTPPIPYGYAEYLRDYLDTCKPDLLMIDLYPFVRDETWDAAACYTAEFFKSLAHVREAALARDIPYWIWVQTFGTNGGYYYPSESEVRMEVFTCLAYGFTGIGYYLYQTPQHPGLLGTDAAPAPLLDVVSDLNREVARLGAALRYLTSVDVRYVPGVHYQGGPSYPNELPVGIKALDSAAMQPFGLAGVEVHSLGANRNALAGFFKDDAGGRYVMVVNLSHARGVSSSDMTMRITITFDAPDTKLFRLSRETGKPEAVALTDGKLELKLTGGSGDLFKIGDESFPGVEATP